MTRLIDADALEDDFAERMSVVPIPRGLSEAAIQHVLRDAPSICCERCEHWMMWDKHRERYDCEIEASGEGFIEPYFGCVHFKEAGR